MFACVIKGKVLDKSVNPDEKAPYCMKLLIEVRTFVSGTPGKIGVEVWFPGFMRKRCDWFAKNDVQNVVVAGNQVTIPRKNDYSGLTVVFALIADEID